jgi:hypothetical protein
VASLPNLKYIHQKEVLFIRDNSWHGKECDLQDLEGVLLTKGCVTIFDLREAILDNILRDDHVGLTIF